MASHTSYGFKIAEHSNSNQNLLLTMDMEDHRVIRKDEATRRDEGQVD